MRIERAPTFCGALHGMTRERASPPDVLAHDERGAIMVIFAVVAAGHPALRLVRHRLGELVGAQAAPPDAGRRRGARRRQSRVDPVRQRRAVQAEILRYAGIGGSELQRAGRRHAAGAAPHGCELEDVSAAGHAGRTTTVDRGRPVRDRDGRREAHRDRRPLVLRRRAGPRRRRRRVHQRPSARIDREGRRLGGALPIGVPDVNPKRGKVQFINEDTGQVLGEAAAHACRRPSTASRSGRWPPRTPIQLTVDSGDRSNIGTRVILSGGTLH